MMRRRGANKPNTTSVRTGTLTLLLLVVAIVLAVVAVLAMQTARSNAARADAFTYNVEQFYKNDAAAQEMLARLDEAIASNNSVAEAIPAEFTIEDGRIKGAYLDGQACAPQDINTTTETYMDGMAADGLSRADADSKPALLIEVTYDEDGYTVHSWSHVRAY